MMVERKVTINGKEQGVYIPLTDIYETSDLYSLKMEMPGIKKENLDIVIDENELRITAKRESDGDNDNVKFSEYNDRDYYRAFKIGHDIDKNRVDANLDKGILSLKLYKSEEVKPKKIEINQIN